jgi:toxin ParE1/3/4
MRLEISVAASRDLQALHLYGIGQYGPTQADVYLEGLFGKFEHIAEWPLATRERLPTQPPVRLSRYEGHNILYSVDGEMVTILRVFHHSANWVDLL